MALARRSFLFSALAFSLMAGGCGWHLRGHVTLPFNTLYVNMPINNKVAADIRRMIAASTNVTLVPEAEGAEAILELLSSGRHREVVSLNMQGEAREYELTLNMTFRLINPDGEEFVPTTTFTASRNMYYYDDEYLSRSAEENVLYNEMQQDLISQLLSRLTTVQGIESDEY